MSTFRKDPEDRDRDRVAGDLRTLRQRVSAGLMESRPAVQKEMNLGALLPVSAREPRPSVKSSL